MKKISLPFRLRPSLMAGAACIVFSHAASAAELSRVPQPSLLAAAILQQDDNPGTGLCEADSEQNPDILDKVKSSLVAAFRAQAEPGFVLLEDYVAPGAPQASAPRVAKAAPAPAVKEQVKVPSPPLLAESSPEQPSKLSYLKSLPHELAETAKALTAHIVSTFNVDPTHASNVVSAAMRNSAKTGLPSTLLLAVIAVESGFKASARNGGARGLMQIIPFWHKDKVKEAGGPEELMKVDKNIAAGSAILKEYIDRNGSVFQGLYRYNASSRAREYSEKVLRQKSGFEAVMTPKT